MSNTNLINDIVLPDSMVVLRNNTAILNSVGAHYDDTYKFKGAKAGSTVNLRTAQEFSVRETMTADVQDVEQKSVSLARTVVRGIDMRYSSAELSQDVSGFREFRLRPAMATLGAKIDSYIYGAIADKVYQAVALPATNLDVDDVLNAGVVLDNMGAAPRDGSRIFVSSPAGHKDIVSDAKALYNASDALSKNYKDGVISVPSLGFNFISSANVSTHTRGTDNGSHAVQAIPTEGSKTLAIDTGAGTILTGDVLTIDSVFEVNPLTKVSTGRLKQFVATADCAGGTGTVNLSVEPAMIAVGPYQNISAAPAVNDAIVVMGTSGTAYPQAMAFHPNAVATGFCDLETPSKGVVESGRMVEDGVSISLVKWFDGINRQEYLRFDVLFGVAVPEPRAACRVYTP